MTDASPTPFGEATALYHKAIKCTESGEHEDALQLLRKAVELVPESADAHTNVGATLAQLGRYEEAVRFHIRAIQLDPGAGPAHYNLGCALLKLGHFEESSQALLECVRLWQDRPDDWGRLALAEFGVGRLHESLQAFERAVELEPCYLDDRETQRVVWEHLARRRELLVPGSRGSLLFSMQNMRWGMKEGELRRALPNVEWLSAGKPDWVLFAMPLQVMDVVVMGHFQKRLFLAGKLSSIKVVYPKWPDDTARIFHRTIVSQLSEKWGRPRSVPASACAQIGLTEIYVWVSPEMVITATLNTEPGRPPTTPPVGVEYGDPAGDGQLWSSF